MKKLTSLIIALAFCVVPLLAHAGAFKPYLVKNGPDRTPLQDQMKRRVDAGYIPVITTAYTIQLKKGQVSYLDWVAHSFQGGTLSGRATAVNGKLSRFIVENYQGK